MKSVSKALGLTLLVGLLLSLVLIAIAVSVVGPMEPAPVIEINGDSIRLASMGAGDWLGAVVGGVLALVIVLFVVPVAVLLPLLLVALVLCGVVAGVLLLAAGAMALVCSPLIVVVGVVWLIVRVLRGGARRRAAADATIAG